MHHDHLIRQTVKRQLRDRQTVERQDREWDNELSYIIHRTHRRHSWTYLSSREAKRKKTIAKPSLSSSIKWIYFCLSLILLNTQIIFYFIAIVKKNSHITGMCWFKYWVLFWYFSRRFNHLYQKIEYRTVKVIFLDHNFLKNISPSLLKMKS